MATWWSTSPRSPSPPSPRGKAERQYRLARKLQAEIKEFRYPWICRWPGFWISLALDISGVGVACFNITLFILHPTSWRYMNLACGLIFGAFALYNLIKKRPEEVKRIRENEIRVLDLAFHSVIVREMVSWETINLED